PRSAVRPVGARPGAAYGKVVHVSAIPLADDVLDADVAVLPVAEVATRLNVAQNKVRQMLRDGQLIAVRRDGDLVIPEVFFRESAVVKGLAGTITVLSDAGFTRTEMLRWLFTEDESLPGITPI